jgi:RTX calcium-binding nonapeptide repeat (4 copies)
VHSGHPGRLITTPSRRPEHSPRTPRGTVASGMWSGAGSRASPRRAGSRRRSHERGRATDHPARSSGGFGLGDAAREATRPLLLLGISLCFVGEHRRTRRVTPAWWSWQAAWRVFQRRRRQARRGVPARRIRRGARRPPCGRGRGGCTAASSPASCGPATPARPQINPAITPCVCALDASDPLYADCIADDSAICDYAGYSVDCPQGGCLGFSMTLPASFATDPTPDPRPDPVPFPRVHGGSGRDVIDAGTGRDRLMGGSGRDVCTNGSAAGPESDGAHRARAGAPARRLGARGG